MMMSVRESQARYPDEMSNASEILEVMKNFSTHQKSIRGLALFGSYARKEQSVLSDLDLVMIIDKNESNEEVFQNLLSALTQKPGAILHPLTNKWILFFSNGIQKVDLFIVHTVKEIEHFFRNSQIRSGADAILVDKDEQLEGLIAIGKMNLSPQDISAMINGTVEKFLESFYLAAYYSGKGDRYLFFFNYSIAHFHLAELMQIETDDYSYLYSPRNLLDRITPGRKEQLERTSIGVAHSDERMHLHNIAKVFLEVYWEIPRQHADLQWKIPSIEAFFEKNLGDSK